MLDDKALKDQKVYPDRLDIKVKSAFQEVVGIVVLLALPGRLESKVLMGQLVQKGTKAKQVTVGDQVSQVQLGSVVLPDQRVRLDQSVAKGQRDPLAYRVDRVFLESRGSRVVRENGDQWDHQVRSG